MGPAPLMGAGVAENIFVTAQLGLWAPPSFNEQGQLRAQHVLIQSLPHSLPRVERSSNADDRGLPGVGDAQQGQKGTGLCSEHLTGVIV